MEPIREVFIYGSLRNRSQNREVITELGFSPLEELSEPCIDGVLLSKTNISYPFAIPETNKDALRKILKRTEYLAKTHIKGEVITIKDVANTKTVLQNLDRFEGVIHDSSICPIERKGRYVRQTKPVHTHKNGKVEQKFTSYCYLANTSKSLIDRLIEKSGFVVPNGDWLTYQTWRDYARLTQEAIKGSRYKKGLAMGLETEGVISDGVNELSNLLLKPKKGIKILFKDGRENKYDNLRTLLSEFVYNELSDAEKNKLVGRYFRNKKDRDENRKLPTPFSLLYLDGELKTVQGHQIGIGGKKIDEIDQESSTERFFEICGIPQKAEKGFATKLAEYELNSRSFLSKLPDRIKGVKKGNIDEIVSGEELKFRGHSTQYNVTTDTNVYISELVINLNEVKTRSVPPTKNSSKGDFPKLTADVCEAISKSIGGAIAALSGDVDNYYLKFGPWNNGRIEIRTGVTYDFDQLRALNLFIFGAVNGTNDIIKTKVLTKASETYKKQIHDLGEAEIHETFSNLKIDEILETLPFIIDNSVARIKKRSNHRDCFQIDAKGNYPAIIGKDPYNNSCKIQPFNIYKLNESENVEKRKVTALSGIEMAKEIFYNPYFNHYFRLVGTNEEYSLLESFINSERPLEKSSPVNHFKSEKIYEQKISGEFLPDNWADFYTNMFYANEGRLYVEDKKGSISINIDTKLSETKTRLEPHKLDLTIQYKTDAKQPPQTNSITVNIDNYAQFQEQYNLFLSGDITSSGLFKILK